MVHDDDTIESIAEFERPPVVEVVLGVQYSAPVIDLEVLADFAKSLRADYPDRQQLDSLPHARESFERPPAGPRIQFQIGSQSMPRTWFQSEDGAYLVQVQADRLIVNWRRVQRTDTYPRYASIRPRFDDLRHRLEAIITATGRPPAAIDQVEVSYINELSCGSASEGLSEHPPLGTLLTTINDTPAGGFLPQPEDSEYGARFLIPGTENPGVPAGRLLIATEPAYRAHDEHPIYLLKLTANLVGDFEAKESVTEMLNLGRSWIVNAFTQVTTPDVQASWGPIS